MEVSDMKRLLMMIGPILLLAALGVSAAPDRSIGQVVDRGWGIPPDTPGDTFMNPPTNCTPVVIGTAQPETDGTAVGWDVTPAAGNWGGRGADGSFAVAWENDQPDVPALLGRFAEVTVPGLAGYVPTKVEVGYLAGVANDDFCVLVRMFRSWTTSPPTYITVDCFNEDEYNTTEVWTTALFPLPRNVFCAGQDMTIHIRVTGNAWSGKATWGQFAVDYIKIWGVPRVCA